MTPLQILFSFTSIIFPIFLAVPTFLTYVRPLTPTRKFLHMVAIMLSVPILDLWITILIAIIHLCTQETLAALVTIIALVASGIMLTFALLILTLYLGEELLDRIRRGT